ncbi:hypothetical protein AC1031_017356 [Aphanomyces cochlioides]|nr:hypothetical protein AC1031_017356 [Aphanomyces cochlioides]
MQDTVNLTAHLTCSYFHAGTTVRGYVKIDSPTHLYIEWGVAQVHGHLCVDADALTIPLVSSDALDESFAKTLKLPDVKTFSGPTGVCIYQSKPTVLYSEIDVPYTIQSHYAIGLPSIMCPSFKGTSARVFYVVSFTFKIQGTAEVQCLHLPFDIYAKAYYFASPSLNKVATSPSSIPFSLTSPTDDNRATPVAVRHGHEIPFEMKPRLMHGRVETERGGGTQTRQYTIRQDKNHLVIVKFFKQRYMPGDEILLLLDFEAAMISCASISASLVVEERLGELSLHPGRVVAKQTLHTIEEVTMDALQTHMRFSLPIDTKTSIETDVVMHEYLLEFAFETKEGVLNWSTPVLVVPPYVPDPSHLNVPDQLFHGPTRSRTLVVLA